MIYSRTMLKQIFSTIVRPPRLEPGIWNTVKVCGIARSITRRGCRAGSSKPLKIPVILGNGRYGISKVNISKTDYKLINSSNIQTQTHVRPVQSRMSNYVHKLTRKANSSNCVRIKKSACQMKPTPKIMVFNARSIAKDGAIPLMASDISSNSIDICIITETWLHNHINDNSVSVDGYNCIRKDRGDRQGGGVCIYSRQDWKMYKPSELENDFECQWVKISVGKNNEFFVGAVYYYPGTNCEYKANDLIEYLSESCDQILTSNPHATVIIAGDKNQLNIRSLLSQNSLSQLVKKPTRKNNILDIFITNHPHRFKDVRNVESLVRSDHLAVIVSPRARGPPPNRKIVEFRDVREHHKITMSNALKKTDFSEIIHCFDVEKATEKLYSIIGPLLDEIFPVKRVKISSRDPIYITPLIKQFLMERSKLIKRGRISEANSLQLRINNLIRKKRIELVQKNSKDKGSYKWWKMVDTISGRKPKSISLTTLFNIEDINNYFQAINTDPDYKEPANIIIQDVSEAPTLSEYNVFKQLQSLKRTSPGPDGIPYWFWRDFSPQLTTSLCYIFNLSLTTGTIPSCWKSANVSPIPKDNPVSSISQLRPISVTDVIIRVFERLVFNRYIKHDCMNDIGSDQFAFRKGGSTTQALLRSQHKWNEWLDAGADCVRVFAVDFKKAFDMVSHNIVCKKLSNLNLNPYIMQWICNFLSNRCQRISIHGLNSTWLEINRGVPQGTILGPFLFSVMVDDIKPIHKKTTELVKYADDMNLAIFVKNGLDNSSEEMENILHWAEENKMEFNLTKTKELVYKSTRKRTPLPPPIENIERVPFIRTLGVFFSSNPDNWDKHFQALLHKVNTRFYILRTCKNNGYSLIELSYLFHSLVVSVITYCIQVWGAANTSYISQIDNIFKRAERCRFIPTVMSTETLIEQCDTKLWQKIIKNNSQINDLLPPKRTRMLRERKHNYILPKVKTERFKRCFINRCLFR